MSSSSLLGVQVRGVLFAVTSSGVKGTQQISCNFSTFGTAAWRHNFASCSPLAFLITNTMCIDPIRRSYQYRNVQQAQQFSDHKSGLFSFQRIQQYCIQISKSKNIGLYCSITRNCWRFSCLRSLNHVFCLQKVISLLPHFHKKNWRCPPCLWRTSW